MIRKISSKKKFYSVSSSDWQVVVASSSQGEAAIEGFKQVYDKYKQNLNLSSILSVCDLSNLDTSIEHECHIFYMPELLLDAGFPNLSRTLESIIKKV
jgi:hypothetical protein